MKGSFGNSGLRVQAPKLRIPSINAPTFAPQFIMPKDTSKYLPERNALRNRIFQIRDEQAFEALALDIFRYQVRQNPVYASWVNALGVQPETIASWTAIPFMPISLFKAHRVFCGDGDEALVFESSGTTGSETSRHFVADPSLYHESIVRGFEIEYGPVSDYVIIGLLPAYLERKGASLVYMTEQLIRASGRVESGFYLYNYDALLELLESLARKNQKTWLIGVTFALLDLALLHPPVWEGLTVVETGGMKGRRKELIREALHSSLRQTWPVENLHSEYGMTELLSQAWMKDGAHFQCPPWMKVRIRESDDPLAWAPNGRTGGIDVVDLANLDSCAFLATADLGRMHEEKGFEVLGRFDHATVRGCNLLVG